MKLLAGETVNVKVDVNELTIKIEDASKGDVISARVESVHSGDKYKAGEIYEFERSQIQAH